jgi:hypothetical protein
MTKTMKNATKEQTIDTAIVAQMAAELEAPVTEEPVAPVTVVSLPEALQNVTEDAKAQMLTRIGTEFDLRAAHELATNPANGNIQDTLKKQAKKMALPGIAAMILATNVDPGVINRSISEGKRFNVYAIDKLNDLLHGLNSGHFKNEINQAVMRSMFKFRKAGVAFTGTAALAAASDKVIVDNALKGLLVRHTVAAATAPTQSSSTMSALIAIGAVVNKGSAKYPIYELTNAPVVKELEAKFA